MELAALLTSKICHDLISPVGAINNGLEVMADEANADMHEFALDLVVKSAEQASNKLQFCRMAYGAGSSAGSEIDLGEAGQVTRGFIESERTKLNWAAPHGALAKDKVKLLLNLFLVAYGAIPRGGTVDITLDELETNPQFKLVCKGRMVRVPPKFLEIHSGQLEEAIDAHAIQPYYTVLLADEAGMKINCSANAEEVVFTAHLA